jgi:hypothetical protein
LSAALAGLCELARSGEIRLALRPSDERAAHTWDPLTLWLELSDPEARRARSIAIDLLDRSDQFALPALERCDAYFKRSFHAPDLRALAPLLRAKVRPYGLNFACRTWDSTLRVLATTLPRGLLRWTPLAFGDRSALRAELDVWRQYVTTPLLEAFEHAPSEPVDTVVMFQTRVWGAMDMGPDRLEEVNRPRVALVRALRHAFGPRFRGGLVPTDLARSLYPDALSAEPSRRDAYVAFAKRALVGIYTRGLHHSLAFKLGEYLASSKCMVSEPLRNELPAPLRQGEHLLEYQSIEECVSACDRLLSDPTLASEMRWNNWRYYRRQTRPAERLRAVLKSALAAAVPDETSNPRPHPADATSAGRSSTA